MAIDIHRGLGKVDGSLVDISTDRYKGREEKRSPAALSLLFHWLLEPVCKTAAGIRSERPLQLEVGFTHFKCMHVWVCTHAFSPASMLDPRPDDEPQGKWTSHQSLSLDHSQAKGHKYFI